MRQGLGCDARACARADAEPVDDNVEGHTPDRFEKKKHIKQQLETAREKFNINATRVRCGWWWVGTTLRETNNKYCCVRQGVQYLVDAGLVENTPESIARFMREHNGELDKVQIGEYFGKGCVLAPFGVCIDIFSY